MLKEKLIGVYEMITGLFGFIIVLLNINKLISHPEIIFSFIAGLLLFGAVTYAGYALAFDRKNGYNYSFWVQGLQTLSLTWGGIRYLFTGSAFIAIVFNSEGAGLLTKVSPIDYTIAKVSDSLPWEVQLFVIPLILIGLLLIKKN